MFTNYSVVVEKFSERHYAKKFKKKYKKAWVLTQSSLIKEFQRIDALIEKTSIAEIISEKEDIQIVKTEFRVAGTKQSAKNSGNRCIIAVHKDVQVVKVLLIYHKNDLTGSGNETSKWKKIIRDNFGEYEGIV